MVNAGATSPLRRWLQVAAAAAFINTTYGTLFYAFSVLVTRQAAGGEFGPGAIALGFGLAGLVGGLSGIAVGTVADLFGTRRLMALGSVAGAGALVALSLCREPWQAVLVMALAVGPAATATSYGPVYVLMNRWFEARERPRAYGVLTLMSGVSITIFVPLTQWLVEGYGWERAVQVLAAILLCIGLAVPALVHEPLEARNRPVGTARRFFAEAREGLRHATPAFWAFSIAFFAATTAFSGFSFHMVSQLQTRGFDESSVARAIAVTGIVSLPTRLLLPMLSARVASAGLLAACLGLLGVAALIASSAGQWWQVWLYVAVFGAVFGAIYPLRALVTSERFAGPYFGRLIGLQALFVAAGGAAGPILIGVIGTDRDAYRLGFQLAALVLFASAAGTWLSMRGSRAGHAPTAAAMPGGGE
jgi:MFS family permease